MQEAQVRSLGQEDPLEKEMADPLQYSCLENPMDRAAWWAIIHGVAESWTRLSNFTFTLFHFHTQSHYTPTQMYVIEMNYNQLYYNHFFSPRNSFVAISMIPRIYSDHGFD